MAPYPVFPLGSRKFSFALTLGIFLAAAIAPAASAATTPVIPPNANAACGTQPLGAGAGARLDVEVRDNFGPYGGDQATMVSDSSGMPLVTLACDGASEAFRLAPGSYRVRSFIGDAQSSEVAVNVSSKGARISLMLVRATGQRINSPQLD